MYQWRSREGEEGGGGGGMELTLFYLEPEEAQLAESSPTQVGSKSKRTVRGTCFPAPVSSKKVV